MTSSRLAAPDAHFHWLRDEFPSDQFLVYCFTPPRSWPHRTAQRLLDRARNIVDLNLRVCEVPGSLDFPLLVPREPKEGDVVIHHLKKLSWSDCLDAIGVLIGDQLRAEESAWRIHLFGPIDDSPAGGGPVVVVVLQVAHVLGDGRRTAAIARELFGRNHIPDIERRPAVGAASMSAVAGVARFPLQFAQTLRWGMASYAESVRRQKVPGHEPASVPGERPPGVPVTVLNRPSGPKRSLRTLLLDRAALTGESGATVTATALSAISRALADYLDVDADHPLAAELTVGVTPQPGIRNNFRNWGVPLPHQIGEPALRTRTIAADVERAKVCADHRTRTAARRAEDATPPVLMRKGLRQFDAARLPERMTGVTVVSSINRGRADLALVGRPARTHRGVPDGQVLFTTGFPALSPMQGLTHGVHGIGNAVVLSVATSPDVMPDVDRYVGLLRDAIGQSCE